jgi:hypothetical protein
MRLQDIASGSQAVAVPFIGGDVELAREIQTQLGALGLLDPPVDGQFGPVSHWALAQLLSRMKLTGKKVLDAEIARALLAGKDSSLFPINPATNFAGRLVAAAQRAGYWLCRHPDCVNILYVEGMDGAGKANSNLPNEFNDVRVLLRINRAGNPDIADCWDATSEPGRYYALVKKLDPRGAARIAFGQYKAWAVGTHMAGRPSGHEALVQTGAVRVFRDLNADFKRTGDAVFEGVFGINQHWGYDLPRSDIGRASAGCLVGRTKTGHRGFMSLCKSDPRYLSNNGYRFMTGVLPASDLA